MGNQGLKKLYSHNLCFEQKYDKYQFLSDNFQFLEMKFSIYLNKRVFVMDSSVFESLTFYCTILCNSFVIV